MSDKGKLLTESLSQYSITYIQRIFYPPKQRHLKANALVNKNLFVAIIKSHSIKTSLPE